MENSSIAKPAGPYSHAVVVNDLIFVSGQLPINALTNTIETSFEVAVKQVFINLETVLKFYKSNMNSIVKVNIYLTDSKQIEAFNNLYKTMLTEPYPARSLVVVKDLPRQSLLMIDVVAKKVG
jgi:2-iminobutanoate/2-iminopropanoate deaminase